MSIDRSVIQVLQEFQEEGKPDFVKELFEMFVNMTPPMLQKIERALETRDTNTIARTCHNLKSQSGNLGALKLSILSGELETLARQPTPTLEKMATLYQSISKEYAEVEKELRALLFG